MNASEFLMGTLRPVLMEMDMWSAGAEKLLLMTAAHESGGFRHREQVGGPARSYYQIEPLTALHDLYKSWLAFRPEKAALLARFLPEGMTPEAALMDDRYATAAARLIYFRVPQPLPPVHDDEGMARYWKTFWNTTAGKGTVPKFLDDWRRYKPEDYP